MFSNIGTPFNYLLPTAREQGANQVVGRDTNFNNAEKLTVPTLSQLQAIKPNISGINESAQTGADVDSYSLGSELSVGSSILSRRYERIRPSSSTETGLDAPLVFQYNTTGWTPLRSISLEYPIDFTRPTSEGIVAIGSSKQPAMTFMQTVKTLTVTMGNNSLVVNDTFPFYQRKPLHAILREKTVREIQKYYSVWGMPYDQLISAASFERTNPDANLNREYYFAGDDYSESIFSRAQNAYWGTYYVPGNPLIRRITWLPLFLMFPEFDNDMLLPPGFPIKIEFQFNTDVFESGFIYNSELTDTPYVNYFPTQSPYFPVNNANVADLIFLRSTSLIVNQQTNAAWFEALQKKPFVYTVPNYSFTQEVRGDGQTLSFSVSLQPVAMIPIKIVLECINYTDVPYFFPNPFLSNAFSGGNYDYNTDVSLGKVNPGGYMPYQIDRIQVLGQNGEEYYVYRNEVLTQEFNNLPVMSNMDSYETNLEHEELCERNPSCHPEGIHRNRIRCITRSAPYVIDLSNNTAGYRGATNISLNQLKAEQLTINFTIRTIAKSTSTTRILFVPSPGTPLVPLPATSIVRVSALFPTQIAINASFNVEKVAAPILLQSL